MDEDPPAAQRFLTLGVLPDPVLTWRNNREYVPVNRLIRRSTWRFAAINSGTGQSIATDVTRGRPPLSWL